MTKVQKHLECSIINCLQLNILLLQAIQWEYWLLYHADNNKKMGFHADQQWTLVGVKKAKEDWEEMELQWHPPSSGWAEFFSEFHCSQAFDIQTLLIDCCPPESETYCAELIQS